MNCLFLMPESISTYKVTISGIFHGDATEGTSLNLHRPCGTNGTTFHPCQFRHRTTRKLRDKPVIVVGLLDICFYFSTFLFGGLLGYSN